MDRALRTAYRMAAVDSVGVAYAVIEGALAADDAARERLTDRLGRRARRDTLRAYLIEKRAYLHWRMGDRAGALHSYGMLWNASEVPLPDSLLAEVFRSAAYIITDTTADGTSAMGDPLTQADTLNAIRLLDRAEVEARKRGQGYVASVVSACKARLLVATENIRTVSDGACAVSEDCPGPGNTTSDLRLIAAILFALSFGAVGWHARKVWGRVQSERQASMPLPR